MHDLAVLDAIERLELGALRWGFVDGAVSTAEAMAIAESLLGTREAAEAALDRLLRRHLLFEVRAHGHDDALRSRFAETVRLMSRLRQQFPNRLWNTAPRLVSDYRVDVRPRRYPDRNRPAREVFGRVAGDTPTTFRTALWQALTGDDLVLADFQETAARRLLHSPGDQGLIVTAGTGSGKTLAFYLPALIRIAEEIDATQHWTKALAIYPRTELLKDQFAETYRMARRLDRVMTVPRRPLRIGAYFGSTPSSASPDELRRRKWRRLPSGDFVCPWLPCPRCADDLLWRAADIAGHREQLFCASPRCQGEVDETEIILTRTTLGRTPPDILFTTTEMLNQRLSDVRARRLFGVGQPSRRRPIFALLDEVHTYTGVAGAQAALTLRRWRHALASQVVYVGLSATLREAPQFFADLTGLDPASVMEASPGEMRNEGAEYQIILRGDPASQTSLLSTSIQSLMLLARMLDPLQGGLSDGAYGTRIFAFTDNLDVINRLFDSLRDAEGLNIFGRPQVGVEPLAALRQRPPDPAAQVRRDRDGQVWRAAELIGHDLRRPLTIGRTASEDPGVLGDANVIIATAALEVGYNDGRVGAVLQHKAPKDTASFLQRRGRAGRTRGMRPLTVTVLSDYGRDRIAFEAYEHLFDPELPPQRLPISNDYVLRMQACYSFFDWLTTEPNFRTGWAWDVLSRPDGPNQGGADLRSAAKRTLVRLLEGDGEILARLSMHLKSALKIDQTTLDAVLWRPPRALLLEAIPTLARRLHRDWRLAQSGGSDRRDVQTDWHPLPDFVARTLFSDLNLPEVNVVLPPATVRDREKIRSMPIASALTELAPGRVTRRFAVEHGGLHHWSPLDPDLPEQAVRIDQYAEIAEPVTEHVLDGVSLPVYRPWQVRLHHAARPVVGPTSNAALKWHSGFTPSGDSGVIDIGPRNPWRAHVAELAAFLHRQRSHVTVRRAATGGEAILRRPSGDRRISYYFEDATGARAAIGFEIEVDALVLRLDLTRAEARIADLPLDLAAAGRLGYLRRQLMTDLQMPSEVDPFQRDWLHQVFLAAALVRAAADETLDLAAAAISILDDPEAGTLLQRAMAAIFQGQTAADTPPAAEEDEEAPIHDDDGSTSAQGQGLTQLLHREDIRERLRAIAAQMSRANPDALAAWIRDTAVATLAEATLQACISLVPRHVSSEALSLDVESCSEGPRIWITESTLGGAGVLQAVFEQVADEPRAFFQALEAALAATDYELAADGLEAVVGLTQSEPVVAAAVERLRNATAYGAREIERRALYQDLGTHGLDVGHALSVSMNARLFAPGCGATLDALLAELIERWRALESRLGVAVGVREIAFVLAMDPVIQRRVQVATGLPQALSPSDAAQVLANLLWPRGVEIAQRSLQSYSRYAPRRATDPRLVRWMFGRAAASISFAAPDWRTRLAEALARDGSAALFAPLGDQGALRAAVVEALVTPIDVGYLQFFPKVDRLERTPSALEVWLVVPEQV